MEIMSIIIVLAIVFCIGIGSGWLIHAYELRNVMKIFKAPQVADPLLVQAVDMLSKIHQLNGVNTEILVSIKNKVDDFYENMQVVMRAPRWILKEDTEKTGVKIERIETDTDAELRTSLLAKG